MAQSSSYNRKKGAGWLLLMTLKAMIDGAGGPVYRHLGLVNMFGITLMSIAKREAQKEVGNIQDNLDALAKLQERYDPQIEEDHGEHDRSVFEGQIDAQLIDLLSIAFEYELIDPDNMPTSDVSGFGSVKINGP